MRRINYLENFFQDLRYGMRQLRCSPGFAAIAVLTLALGIGANTAIFSVVNAVLLRPMPYPDSDRLVTFWLSAPSKGLPEFHLTDAHFAFYRDRSRSFETMAAYTSSGFNLTGQGEPVRLRGTNVTFDFFRVFGQQPIYGRTFLPQEDTPKNSNFTVLSYGLWQRRFGGDPSLVGKSLDLNNTPTLVVGIMPVGFDFPDHTELWVSLGLDPQRFSPYYLRAVGRVKPGVTPQDARRELSAVDAVFVRENPGRFPDGPQKASDGGVVMASLRQKVTHEARTPLLVLFGAVAFVLLIACANIANLLLARATSRRLEIAMRVCLGASPERVRAQLATESLLLALLGAAGGLLLAFWGIRAMARLPQELIPRVGEVRLDPVVLLFTLGIAFMTGLLFGLAPALRGSRANLQEVAKGGTAGTGSTSSRRLNNTFVVAQLALSLVLLVGAGLLLESFQRLLAVNPGFREENVLVAHVDLESAQYQDDAQKRNFYQRLLEGVRSLPGVRAAGLSVLVPFGGYDWQDEFIVEGHEPAPGEAVPVMNYGAVSPGYFETMGIPILQGRSFQEADGPSSPPVAIVSETLARRYFPDGRMIGKQIRTGNLRSRNPWLTIVGVAAGVKNESLDQKLGFDFYRPFAQAVAGTMFIVVRTVSDPAAMTSVLRKQVSSLDPEVPLYDTRTMEQAVAESLDTRRLTNLLLTSFAATALLIAAVGLYGVMWLNASSRAKEFALRMALGAQRGDVFRLVMGQGILLAIVGVGIGLAGALSLSRFLSSLLYDTRPTDAPTFALVSLGLVGVALLASYIPARRATSVDPMAALRHE